MRGLKAAPEFILDYRISDNKMNDSFCVTYTITNAKTGQIIAENEKYYYSARRAQFNSVGHLRNYVLCGLRMWVKATHGVCSGIHSRLQNTDDKWAEGMLEPQTEHVAPQKICDNTQRIFEVIQENGVWTIIKHDRPLLTEQQAKIEFFAKVVNA